MLDDFIVRAGLAGIAVALAAGPLGCFVTWRRMAYFGDATAHAAILGVALAIATSLPLFAGVLVTSAAIAIAVAVLSGRYFASDTILGVASHAGIAIGLVALSLTAGARVDIESLLFGEILAVSVTDLTVIWVGAGAVVGLLIWRWSRLLVATLNPDMAIAAGVNPRRETLVLTLALAVLVAISIKVVGALLITAMLIVPAATARPLSNSPEAMALWAAVAGGVSVIGGIWTSYIFNSPTGPTIVALATVLFTLSALMRPLRR
jgi:zinc transport system permease protein